VDHFHNINFLDLLKFGTHRITNQTPFSHFLLSELWICCAPQFLARTGKFGTWSLFRSLARSTMFLRLYRLVVGL